MIYEGSSNSDIYAQRIDADGNPLWTKDGIPICAEVNAQNSPCIATDGAGGPLLSGRIFALTTQTSVPSVLIRMGEVLWAKDGALVCGASGAQSAPVVVDDGVGGVIVTWQDFRRSYADTLCPASRWGR